MNRPPPVVPRAHAALQPRPDSIASLTRSCDTAEGVTSFVQTCDGAFRCSHIVVLGGPAEVSSEVPSFLTAHARSDEVCQAH